MGDIIAIVLGCFCLVLACRLRRLKQILSDFAEAAENKTAYLQHEHAWISQRFRIDRLVRHYADLLSHERQLQAIESQMQNQIDAILGRIQEAVFSINPNNVIIHANKAACDTFFAGKPIRGKRIEELLRNPDFLDYAHRTKSQSPVPKREVEINLKGRISWFEVSGTALPPSELNPDGSALFVFHDITRLKELEIVKNNFVANVSHELKTPITIIKGFTETLVEENEELESETRLKFLRKIESNTERLHLIVQDLLTLSRIESDANYLKQQPQTLSPLLAALVENNRSLLRDGQQLEMEDATAGLLIHIDGFKISQVYQNLIDNAMRYAGENATIVIRAEADLEQPWVMCSVRDTGKGIPEADLPNIFRRFYRVDKARSRINGGTGLGLSIARGIVELHGGSIRAENLQEGGLRVTFTLPIHKAV